MQINRCIALFCLSAILLTGCTSQVRLPSNVYKGKKSKGRNAVYARNKKGESIQKEVVYNSSTVRSESGSLLANYAQLIGVQENELHNYALYELIDDWMGVPHADGGNTKRGIDCSGFATILMEEVYGKSIPRISSQQAELVKRKYEDQLQEGDLVFFSFGKKMIDHVGIYLANNKFVHVSTSSGVVISDLKDAWYYPYFVRCGSIL
ncbi:C40 family peptidase [Olivibacter sitiensis]|uniref:C40 family peptidase n=1 Tax=Olivibacter sitiensis TaxID=376470 RepID=UPI0004274D38|nr:NlpC/P60 family protein [Olivibacter sitiensis]